MVTSGPIHQPTSISQQHQAPDEDDNRNHLAPSTTSILGSITNEELDYEPEENVGFTLQVTFHKGTIIFSSIYETIFFRFFLIKFFILSPHYIS